MHSYVERSKNKWIESAILAKHFYHENQQYKLFIQNNEVHIIPVNNSNTGTSISNGINI